MVLLSAMFSLFMAFDESFKEIRALSKASDNTSVK